MIQSTDHRPRLLAGCLLGVTSVGLFFLGTIAPTFGQAAPAARPAGGTAAGPATAPVRVTRGQQIADTLKRAPTGATLIPGFVRPEVALLTKPDLKVPGISPRVALDRGAGTETDPPAHIQYQLAYADELSKALTPLFKDPDARVRLNAAIVTAKAAARISDPIANARLIPLATAALSDKSEPVVLWGVKAANGIIPRQLDGKADPKLAAAVVRAVQANPQSGAIIEDAYDTFAGPAIIGSGVPQGRKTAALPGLISLVNTRAAAYKKVDPNVVDPATGELPFPGSPQADNVATLFYSRVWSKQTPPAQKQQIAQSMLDLSTELVRLAPAVLPRAGGDPPESVRRDDLITVLSQTGKAMMVIADREAKPELRKAAEGISQITPATGDDALTDRLAAFESALKAASLLPAAPAGAPSTAPVAGS